MLLRSGHRSPFGGPFDGLFGWRRLLRTARNLLFVAVACGVFVEIVGEPHLRGTYRYRGTYDYPVYVDATYYGLSGRRQSYAGEFAEGCPIIVFVKHNTPLWRRLASLLPSNPF